MKYPLNFNSGWNFSHISVEDFDYLPYIRRFPRLARKYPHEIAVALIYLAFWHGVVIPPDTPLLRYQERLILSAIGKIKCYKDTVNLKQQIIYAIVVMLKHPPTRRWVSRHGAVIDHRELTNCDRRAYYSPNTVDFCKSCVSSPSLYTGFTCIKHHRPTLKSE